MARTDDAHGNLSSTSDRPLKEPVSDASSSALPAGKEQSNQELTIGPSFKTGRLSGLLLITLAYLLACCASVSSIQICSDQPLLVQAAVAYTTASIVVFCFSYFLNNSSVYDAYWSVGPPLLLLFFAGSTNNMADTFNHPGRWLVVCVVFGWAIRLTLNWARGFRSLSEEDFRYVDLKRKTGPLYWLVSLTGIHLFPSILTFAGSLPFLSLFTDPQVEQEYLILIYLGGLIALCAVFIEGIADHQLHRFRESQPPQGSVYSEGLWRYSRHPNYFGEMLFWWGLALAGYGANPEFMIQGIGALSITSLFVFISLPMIDQRMLSTRPHYAERMKRVSALIPLPNRQG
ncbi:MAG: DUF1295 domain-containing protein [Polyangiaceae bacterium]|nr:DUF1295 domain-containing protein [Polyangiaceae bacterium]